jgi:hypothetical protein
MAKIGRQKDGVRQPREAKKRPPRGAASPTSPRRLQALEKQRQAVTMRIAGASFDDIAEALGYASRAGAHKAIMTAIQSTLPEPVEAVRQLELNRLDRLWLAVWPAALQGNPQAVEACLKIMKRRAEFEGLDKAKKFEHAGPGGKAIPVQFIDFGLGEAKPNEGPTDIVPAGGDFTGGENEISVP